MLLFLAHRDIVYLENLAPICLFTTQLYSVASSYKRFRAKKWPLRIRCVT